MDNYFLSVFAGATSFVACLHSAHPAAFGALAQEDEPTGRLESTSLSFPLKILPRVRLAPPQEDRPQAASASIVKPTKKTLAIAVTKKLFITLSFQRTIIPMRHPSILMKLFSQ